MYEQKCIDCTYHNECMFEADFPEKMQKENNSCYYYKERKK